MPFPKLIRQSSGLQRIPYPEDFGLDRLVDDAFSHSHFNTFVRAADVAGFARNVMYRPETDPDIIRSRQEVLRAFMGGPDLVALISQSYVDPEPQYDNITIGNVLDLDRLTHHMASRYSQIFQQTVPRTEVFNDLVNRATQYMAYIDGLAKTIPQSPSPELEAFRQYVNELSSESERMMQLRTALSDIRLRGTLHLETTFFAGKDYNGDFTFSADEVRVTGMFPSGRQATASSAKYTYNGYKVGNNGNTFGIILEKLLSAAVLEIKEKDGLDISAHRVPAKLEVDFDAEGRLVSGTVTYTHRTIDWLRSLRSLRPVHKEEVRKHEVPLSSESGRYGNNVAVRHLLYQEYGRFLASTGAEIRELSGAAVELVYLAKAAAYFDSLSRSGVKLTMPQIADMADRITQFTGLVDPGLVRKKGVAAVVGNDVDASPKRNLYVITGPHSDSKTVYMNSIGIAQAMTQAGLMVLAGSAVASPKDNLFTHYVRPADLAVGESRHTGELSRILVIVREATGYSMVLADEMCTGTSPEDGEREAADVIRALGRIGATAFVATHFHNLVNVARELPYAGNLHCVVRKRGETYVPTYRISRGFSANSFGYQLAVKMGADGDGLNRILDERAAGGLKLR